MKNNTKPTKETDIQRTWHVVDVKGQVLGRIATKIALLLQGKSKPYFVRNLDCGDYVVVTNAAHVTVTGNKETQKKYYRHSGYPGGFRMETLNNVRSKKPEDIIEHAVKGMLPQNKLRAKMLKRLKIFAEDSHTYQDKFKKTA